MLLFFFPFHIYCARLTSFKGEHKIIKGSKKKEQYFIILFFLCVVGFGGLMFKIPNYCNSRNKIIVLLQ